MQKRIPSFVLWLVAALVLAAAPIACVGSTPPDEGTDLGDDDDGGDYLDGSPLDAEAGPMTPG